MAQKIINVDIVDGDVTIDMQGFSGTACLEATAELEKDLGIVQQRQTKPEVRTRQERRVTQNA